MAFDVVVDRYNYFIVILCWDVHNKVKVSVISGHHTVLTLFAQGNDIEDPIKNFSVNFSVVLTIGIWIQCTFNAFQCLFLDPVFNMYDIVDFVKCIAWKRWQSS